MIENELSQTAEKEKKEEAQKIIREHWQTKLMRFFDKISILDQSPEKKQEIAITVKEGLKNSRLYWIQIILSSLIATFGLLQNSVAVIIGAMLIAPLLQPIQGIAYGIAEGDSRLIFRGIRMLVLSVVLSIFLAYLVVLILPVQLETREILVRTSPNIFDLFIAVSSAIIALLSLSYKKLLESVAGVAMAASLMPPLSVIGIEIALGAFTNAWGAFVLFITNIVAILFVGAVVFIFYGFRPHKEDSDKTAKDIAILVLVILVLSIPLASGLTKISRKVELELESKQIISDFLAKKIPDATLNNIELHGPATGEEVLLSGNIKLPENIDFFADILDETTAELSKKLGKNVQLDLDIIRTASIISRNQKASLKSEIMEALKDIFDTNVKDGILVRTEVTELPDSKKTWSVKALYTIEAGKILEEGEKKVLQKYLAKRFPSLQLKQLWVQLAERQNPAKLSTTEANEQQSQYSAKIEQFLQENITEGYFKNLEVRIDTKKNKLQANVDIFVPAGILEDFVKNFAELIKEFENTLSFEEKNIDYHVFPYYQKIKDTEEN